VVGGEIAFIETFFFTAVGGRVAAMSPGDGVLYVAGTMIGNAVLSSEEPATGATMDEDAFVAALDVATLDVSWFIRLGGEGEQQANAIAVSNASLAVVGAIDMMAVVTSSRAPGLDTNKQLVVPDGGSGGRVGYLLDLALVLGEVQWLRDQSFVPATADHLTLVDVIPHTGASGGLDILGVEEAAAETDGYLHNVGGAGAELRIPGIELFVPAAAASTPDGKQVIVGTFQGTLPVSGDPVVSRGWDAFIVRASL
jgi:hypothetical protein